MLALFVKVPTIIAYTGDPQIFRGFQIFCGSLFAIPLPALRRWSLALVTRVINKRQ